MYLQLNSKNISHPGKKAPEKAPNSKRQAPKKFQKSNSKRLSIEVWNLELFWNLGFGAWNFPVYAAYL